VESVAGTEKCTKIMLSRCRSMLEREALQTEVGCNIGECEKALKLTLSLRVSMISIEDVNVYA